MIEKTMESWHKIVSGEAPGLLDELLHDDCVFLSPIVFSPQKGKDLTKMYLQAAGASFSAGTKEASQQQESSSTESGNSGFHYVKEVVGANHAFLEFETMIGKTYVNGVDIITCDDSGQITEFKVMLRPLQAVNLMHEYMAKMLDARG